MTWIRSTSDKVEREEMNYMLMTLEMFEFGSREEATSKASKEPTTTKWIDRVNKDDAISNQSEGRLACCDAAAGCK